MSRIGVLKQSLLAAVDTAMAVYPKTDRDGKPVTITFRGDGVQVAADDGQVCVGVIVPAKVGYSKEDSSVGLCGRQLAAILETWPWERLELTNADPGLLFEGPSFRVTLPTCYPAPEPTILAPEKMEWHVVSDVINLIRRTSWAIAEKDDDVPSSRATLQGSLWESGGGKELRLVSTDGKVLSVAGFAGEAMASCVAPAAFGRAVYKAFHYESYLSLMELGFASGHIYARGQCLGGAVHILAKAIEGKFPDYRAVMPKVHETIVTCPWDRFGKAVQVMRAAMLDEEFLRATLVVREGAASLVTDRGQISLFANVIGPGAQARFSLDYLTKIAQSFDDSGPVTIGITPATPPVTFSQTNHEIVAMPILGQ